MLSTSAIQKIAVNGAALPKAKRLYLTEVEAEVDGDVFFPPLNEDDWTETRRESHPAGEFDEHPFTFRVLERR